jgi:hypothetical protein
LFLLSFLSFFSVILLFLSLPLGRQVTNTIHCRLGALGGNDPNDAKGNNLAQWLQTGNVIYKSVGTGLMDLSVGMHMIEYAKEKKVGTHVEGF